MQLVSRLSQVPRVDIAPLPRGKRSLGITEELCLFLPVLGSALAGGLSIHAALQEASAPAAGKLAREIRVALEAMEDGMAVAEALLGLQRRIPNPAVVELVSKLIMATRLGSPVVAQINEMQATVQNELDQAMLARVAKSEMRMLIPLVFLILPVSVLFAVFPSITLLQNANY